MSKARSNTYHLVKFVNEGRVHLYREGVCLASLSIEEWSHMIANPEVIEPEPEEKEEILVA